MVMEGNVDTDGAVRVFVSHASQDVDRASRLVASLESSGVPCWIAPRDVRPSSDYAQQIAEAIESVYAFVLMFSAFSGESTHCLREVELAVRRGLPIFPVRLDDAPISGGYEYRLATVQWMNASAPDLLPTLAKLLRAATLPATSEAAVYDPEAVSLAMRRNAHRTAPRISARGPELERIRALLDDVVASGSGRLLLINGESGVGKSILAQAAAAEAAVRGFAIASTVCEPFHEGMSFFPVRELTRQLTARASPFADMSAIYGPGSVEASMAALADVDNVDPTARRDALLATFANMAIGSTVVGDGQPVMLVIDDLERTDPGTTDSLLCLLARLSEAPVVVVGTYRSDIVAANRATHPLTPLIMAAGRAGDRSLELPLGPVGRSSMRDVVASILGGSTALPHSFVDQLWAETEGNALYVREILRSLQDSRADGGARLTQQDGVWSLVGDLRGWQTPTSVEDAIRSRLELMDAESRTELEKASVIGRRFAFAVMMQLTGSDEDNLLERLEECVSLSLIQEASGDEEAFEFTHGKIRDVLYESMSRIRRRKLHSIVADALIALRSTFSEDWEALIGEHLYQSGRFAEAVPLLQSAAEWLLRLSAAREAAGLLEKALHAHDRSHGSNEQLASLRLARVRALITANEYASALDLARLTADDASSDVVSRGWAQDFIGDIHWTTGRREEALTAYRAAEQIAIDQGDTVLELEVCADVTELFERAAEQLAGVRDADAQAFLADSEQYLDRQIALSRTSTDATARARALRNEAKRLRRRGDVLGALEKYEEGLTLTDRRVAIHSLLISYAKTLRFAGRPDEAVDVVDRVLAWSSQSGARRSLGIALHYRALLRFESSGPLDLVKADLDEALTIHREIGYERGIWEVSTLLGEWYAASDRWTDALPLFRNVLKVAADMADADVVDRIGRQLTAIDESGRAARLIERWAVHHV